MHAGRFLELIAMMVTLARLNRSQRWLASLVVVFGLSSCGLVPIPRPRAVPGVVKEIAVVDAATGRPLQHAEVQMATRVQDSGWMNGALTSVKVDPEGTMVQALQGWKPLKVTKEQTGAFRPEPAIRTAYVRPWGLGPLGWAFYSEPQVGVLVSAPRYGALLLQYSPSWCGTEKEFLRHLGQANESSNGALELTEGGALVVRLHESGESPGVR